ncbi:ribonuclease III domain-containing protein [Trichothermofontia sichuanensis B231]|uniref:ribonuclease III domain-containing protein n=1 Tax=Trichothermofontia sichuanensis TaxID=3045816 RepID=UPI002246D81E|nr:ribonuclease III domain-containing protein [Trichothermofontia sichuanensis]UZQ54486.1 ribonuclease III domain-containing protein [Trichothermofontia sichuanensis B231]
MLIEQKLNYFFFDKEILKRSLIRPSYAIARQEAGEPCEDQVAYSVVGDAILRMVLTEFALRSACQTEAEISDWLEFRLTESALVSISEALMIGPFIKLSDAEKADRIDETPEALVQTFKAILGAAYFDGGFHTVRKILKTLFQEHLPPDLN